jgi:hypothetical protein
MSFIELAPASAAAGSRPGPGPTIMIEGLLDSEGLVVVVVVVTVVLVVVCM